MSGQPSFFDRLLGKWRDIAGSSTGEPSADLAGEGDIDRLHEQMQACLDAKGGEVSARVRAAGLGRSYLGLDDTGRERFLKILAEEFDADPVAVERAIAALGEASPHEVRGAQNVLRQTLEPPRRRLLTQFNGLPEGVKFLVDLRADLVSLREKNPAFRALDDDLREMLGAWFDVGFLDLRRITWNASAALLEKLIAYEAVHEIRSWDDLKNRLDSDRRCFAYFHPRMPDEPLIFVEVALVNGLAGNIAELLDERAPVANPVEADTAIFYSISNAQKGLAGISFGGFLIKRVVDVLIGELKSLKTFATLSPVPSFRRWLLGRVEAGEELLSDDERTALAEAAGAADGQDPLAAILNDSTWLGDAERAALVEKPLMRLCAHYLLNETGRGGRALDPVANFHLTNGALVERLCWRANTSEQGFARSAGIMVNYLYDLDKIEGNHEAYSGDGKVIASNSVNRLLKG
ncbi:MAG: malonyl-CoA decarboxylase [Alphaproteobacteria bacterium]|jgi:malonyl-CoA decarboxylase|nr:malonyl-CoA decarboxylase [Alphaproteobacteria bacterium]